MHRVRKFVHQEIALTNSKSINGRIADISLTLVVFEAYRLVVVKGVVDPTVTISLSTVVRRIN